MNHPTTATAWPRLCSIEPSHESMYVSEYRQAVMQGAPAVKTAAAAPASPPPRAATHAATGAAIPPGHLPAHVAGVYARLNRGSR